MFFACLSIVSASGSFVGKLASHGSIFSDNVVDARLSCSHSVVPILRTILCITLLHPHIRTMPMRWQPANNSAKSSIPRRFCAREHLLSHTKIGRCFNIVFSCHTMPHGTSHRLYIWRPHRTRNPTPELRVTPFFFLSFSYCYHAIRVAGARIISSISVWRVRHTNSRRCACLYPCPCGPRRVIDSCCCHSYCCFARIFSVSFVWFLCIRSGFMYFFRWRYAGGRPMEILWYRIPRMALLSSSYCTTPSREIL